MPAITARTVLVSVSVLSILGAGVAVAQEAAQGGEETATDASGAEDVKVLTIWNYDELYFSGFSVDELLAQTTVVNPDGEAIGDVVDLVFRNDGALAAIVAENGGFWDIGDTHVRVPWDEVVLSDAIRRVEVPLTEDSVRDYRILDPDLLRADESEGAAGEPDVVATVPADAGAGPDEFLASDLIGDDAYFADGELHGHVNDLIVIDDDIAAVVIDSEGGGLLSEYYAYPFFEEEGGDLQARYGPRYDLPYEGQEIEVIEQFDYDRLRRRAE